MSLAPKKPGRLDGDPMGSEKPRGKDSFRRKSRFDPGCTPTEQRQKNELMRQFMKNPEGTQNTTAYLEGWDYAFGKREEFTVPRYCSRCSYEAKTIAEMEWHQTHGECGGVWVFDAKREDELRR